MIKQYKNTLVQARTDRFSSGALRQNPIVSVRSFSDDIDKMLDEVFIGHFDKNTKNVCLVALGGYGRHELCPGSDIDLLILHEGDHNHDSIARYVRALWDMGLPLGCVVRSISECKKILGEDFATDTSFLDARYLVGNRAMFKTLMVSVIIPYFSRRKLWFINEIEAAINGSIQAAETVLYTVEPNLKDGICTLRDCQRIRWARRVEEGAIFENDLSPDLFYLEKGETLIRESFHTLLSFRCALHIMAGRRIDVLEFGFQPSVSEYLGMGSNNPELLMERYFRTVRDVKTAILYYFEQKRSNRPFITKLRASLSSLKISKGVRLLDGIFQMTRPFPNEGFCDAAWVIELFIHALDYQASFNTDLLSKLRSIVENFTREDMLTSNVSQQFLSILARPQSIEPVIRVMHETGFLEKLIPEFESIRCKVEYDSYHEFTVDQHTLLALYTLDQLKNDPEFSSQYYSIPNICTLRLAILLHDIGKSLQGNHSYNGAVMVTVICDRLAIDEKQKNDITKLVLNHLELSKLTFQREPEINVLTTFARTIGTIAILDMLYLLTVVDIKSVGKKSWTGWKSSQLQSIYEKIRLLLDGKQPDTGDDEPLFNQEIQQLAKCVQSHNDLEILLESYPEYDRLTFCAIDRKGLFADMAGILSSEGYNILNAQISTTADNKAIDIFTVEPDTTTRIPSEKRLSTIKKKWEIIAAGSANADSFIDERIRLYPPRPVRVSASTIVSVSIDNTISSEYTIIEIHAGDRAGLLYSIALVFARFGINIVSAKLTTRGTQIADVFYVNLADNQKITELSLQETLKKTIREVIS